MLNNEYDVKERLTGCGVHLYIMDSGIYAEHEDFAGRIREGWSVMDRSPNGADDNGHGTDTAKNAFWRDLSLQARIAWALRQDGNLEWPRMRFCMV